MKPLLFDVKSLLSNSIYVKNIKEPLVNDSLHFHNAYEIAFIKKGNGISVVGDSIEKFNDGDLVIVPPYMPHANYSVSNAREGHYATDALVVYFIPDWITSEHLSTLDLSPVKKLFNNLQRGVRIRGNARKRILLELTKLQNNSGIAGIISMLSIINILTEKPEYQVLASIGYSANYSTTDISRIDKVYEFVMNNFKEKISLERVAKTANMTTTSFCKFFKIKTGKTFSNFVNEIRISYACKLLMNEHLDILEICYKSGFNNIASFNKNFKHFTKTVPTLYRSSVLPDLNKTNRKPVVLKT